MPEDYMHKYLDPMWLFSLRYHKRRGGKCPEEYR